MSDVVDIKLKLAVEPNLKQAQKAGADLQKAINEGMQEIKNNPATENIKSAVKASGIKELFKDLGSGFKQRLKPLNTLIKRIERIALYRGIRWLLKSITNALKEGISNLYQWSKLQSSVFGSKFSKTLDSLATKFLEVKNALGAMLSPMIITLQPLIESMANLLIKLANALNQFMSAISGEKTWLKAIGYQTEYAKAANETKKALMGFDELNVLPSSSGSSSDYGKMFEEVAISDNVLSSYKELLRLVISIGAGIAGWRIASGFELGLTKSLKLALAIAGTTELVLSAIDIIKNGATSSNVTSAISGMTVAVLGLNAAFGSTVGIAAAVVGSFALITLGLADMVKQGKLTHDNTMLIVAGLGTLTIALLALGNPIGAVVTAVSMAAVGIMGYWDKIKMSFINTIYAIKQTWDKFANWFNNTGLAQLLNIELKLSDYSSLAKYDYSTQSLDYRKIHARANGGTVPTGDLFIAGESGAELVSHIGGRNTVYNEEQLGNSLAYANESVVNAINTLIGVVKSKSNNVQISANDIRKAVNTSNMRLGV